MPSKTLIELVKRAHLAQKSIVGLCLGSYVLAYANILSGKKATTHWAYGEDFQQRFNDIEYEEDPLYIKQGNILTSAGSAAAIDCCLNLLRETQGSKVANHIGRVMVSAPQRSGGQKQFIAKPVLSNGSDQRINSFIENALNNLTDDHTLNSAAKHCLMSTRSFSRHFKMNFSMSFVEWLIHARLTHSQELLETSTLSITQIAEQSGFKSEQTFRKQFKASYSSPPKEWRKLFNSSY
jgi:transcriptional regulator GlxA family with amidase domain